MRVFVVSVVCCVFVVLELDVESVVECLYLLMHSDHPADLETLSYRTKIPARRTSSVHKHVVRGG